MATVVRWPGKNLNRKFIFGTVAGLLASVMVFLSLFYVLYRHSLEEERAQAARQVNRLLQSSLENAMLKRDLAGLVTIIHRLGEQPNIRNVFIVNPKGEIRFATDDSRVGKHLLNSFPPGEEPSAHFLRDESGREVLRSLNPVLNKPPCQVCHGPLDEKPVNGVLVVDYDAAPLRAQIRDQILLLMGAGALIVVINLIGGWWFIRRFVLKPVGALSEASAELSKGNLSARVRLQGEDELARLGDTFNLMANKIEGQLKRLDESRSFLQSLVDAVPDGIRIVDENYGMMLVNRTFREQTGCPDRDFSRLTCYESAHGFEEPCPAELMTCPLQAVREDPQPLKVIHHHTNCKGERLDVEIYAAPLRVTLEGRERLLLVESIRDLSSEVRFTHEQRLSELGRLAAGVAHEVYNPLSSLKLALDSFAELLEEGQSLDQMSGLVRVMEEEMEQCIAITEKLLRLSAAPSGQDQLVDLVEVAKDTLSLVKWEAEQDGIELELQVQKEPMIVYGNESDMRMLFLNLVQNAFHAMPDGGRLRIEGMEEGMFWEFRVADTGVGIAPKDLPHIFMPFFSRRADGVQGTGLGLAICRAIVREAKGSLEVESEPGRGATFIIRLPAAREN